MSCRSNFRCNAHNVKILVDKRLAKLFLDNNIYSGVIKMAYKCKNPHRLVDSHEILHVCGVLQGEYLSDPFQWLWKMPFLYHKVLEKDKASVYRICKKKLKYDSKNLMCQEQYYSDIEEILIAVRIGRKIKRVRVPFYPINKCRAIIL